MSVFKKTLCVLLCSVLLFALSGCFGASGTVSAENAFAGLKTVPEVLVKEGETVYGLKVDEGFLSLFDEEAWQRCTPFSGEEPLLCVRLSDKYEIWFCDGCKAEIRDGFVMNKDEGVLQYVVPEGTREAVSEYVRTYGEEGPAGWEEVVFLFDEQNAG